MPPYNATRYFAARCGTLRRKRRTFRIATQRNASGVSEPLARRHSDRTPLCFRTVRPIRRAFVVVAEITLPRPSTSRPVRPARAASSSPGRRLDAARTTRICVRVIGRLSEPASFCAAVSRQSLSRPIDSSARQRRIDIRIRMALRESDLCTINKLSIPMSPLLLSSLLLLLLLLLPPLLLRSLKSISEMQLHASQRSTKNQV